MSIRNVTVQVSLKKDIRDKAIKKAENQGFSSLQDVIRALMTAYVKGTMRGVSAIILDKETIKELKKLERKSDRHLQELRNLA